MESTSTWIRGDRQVIDTTGYILVSSLVTSLAHFYSCLYFEQFTLLELDLCLVTLGCHIIMQDLLPLAIRGVLPERVCIPLIKLSNYFKKLCSKVISVSEMQRLEAEIPETICLLEKIISGYYANLAFL